MESEVIIDLLFDGGGTRVRAARSAVAQLITKTPAARSTLLRAKD